MTAPPEPLRERITPPPGSPGGESALRRLNEAARQQDGGDALAALLDEGQVAAFLAAALGDSPYLLDLAAKDVRRLSDILAQAPEHRMEVLLEELRSARWESRAEAMSGLRWAKQNVALTLGLADLAG